MMDRKNNRIRRNDRFFCRIFYCVYLIKQHKIGMDDFVLFF